MSPSHHHYTEVFDWNLDTHPTSRCSCLDVSWPHLIQTVRQHSHVWMLTHNRHTDMRQVLWCNDVYSTHAWMLTHNRHTDMRQVLWCNDVYSTHAWMWTHNRHTDMRPVLWCNDVYSTHAWMLTHNRHTDMRPVLWYNDVYSTSLYHNTCLMSVCRLCANIHICVMLAA